MGSLAEIAGRNLRQYRQERSFSQRKLASLSGLSKQTIVDLESGNGNPTLATLEVLADALKTSTRALLSDTGTEVLVQRGSGSTWIDQGSFQLRSLDQTYGSGYVYNAVIQLTSFSGGSKPRMGTRGMLRHCYVLEGSVELGPEGRTVTAVAGDFVRFPGESEHIFLSLTPTSLVHVCTTVPQQSISGTENLV